MSHQFLGLCVAPSGPNMELALCNVISRLFVSRMSIASISRHPCGIMDHFLLSPESSCAFSETIVVCILIHSIL